MDIQDYYKDVYVKKRMLEFLGGKKLDEVSAFFITQCDTPWLELGSSFTTPGGLEELLSTGLDVSRSLWDQHSLIAHLDLEYVNFDFPAEPYLDQFRSFSLQSASENAIQKILLEYGIAPLHVLSGRGHHFIWCLSRKCAAFGKLSSIGRVPPHLELCYAEPHWPVQRNINRDLGAAYSGLGLLMEYLAYRVRDRATPQTSVPVELTAIEVPPQQRGREMVSIDISEYGDQLHTRVVRIPYSVYLKPWRKGGILTEEIKDKIPLMASVPLFEMGIEEGVERMRDLSKAAELAQRASIQIPDQSEQMLDLIEDYQKSDVAQFHDWYYSLEHHTTENWEFTYDLIPKNMIPPCARHILKNPNDLLLKPACILLVVRIFLALGWHPRHVAGLIRSKFERDYGWGSEWYFYDAATRADFYTRIFSGLIKTNRDDLKFFDCQSVEGSGYCFRSGQRCSLENYRKSLSERVKNERLASRPFNGLFLPEEYF
ncbi:hypothetical protein QA601_07455 [Chitinispirillales bacterium ANBcel5]|uniref:hypothetical protein n=1 Tax=Cellulosispirillum alkaliphilum TaxID=3039283 RepID=UPI002A537C32|nr:hypothetical protein [Chitinispirillales bacterium ANBcel5]